MPAFDIPFFAPVAATGNDLGLPSIRHALRSLGMRLIAASILIASVAVRLFARSPLVLLEGIATGSQEELRRRLAIKTTDYFLEGE